MNLSSSKYDPKVGHTKIAPHSNLSPSLDSKVADWCRIDKTVIWTVLNHVVVTISAIFEQSSKFWMT